MSKTETVAAMRFIGTPNLASMLDENQSLTSAWNELIQSGVLADLDTLAEQQQVAKNRSTLIVFSPYAFVAWVGVLVPADTPVPKGLNHFDLPAGLTAVAQQNANMQLPLPLNHLIGGTLEKFEKAGISLPAHLGQTDRPYFVESYEMSPKGEIVSVMQRVYLGQSTDNDDETYLD